MAQEKLRYDGTVTGQPLCVVGDDNNFDFVVFTRVVCTSVLWWYFEWNFSRVLSCYPRNSTAVVFSRTKSTVLRVLLKTPRDVYREPLWCEFHSWLHGEWKIPPIFVRQTTAVTTRNSTRGATANSRSDFRTFAAVTHPLAVRQSGGRLSSMPTQTQKP